MRISKGITRSRANGNGMSAMEGIARMPSPDEIAAGGSVIPLHHGSPPVGQVQPSTSAAPDLGPVSPELALIDPELARAARERLPDPPRPVPLAEQPVASSPVAPVSRRFRCSSPHRVAAASDSPCSRPLRESLRSGCCSRWSSVARDDPPETRSRLSRSRPRSPRRRPRSPSRSAQHPRPSNLRSRPARHRRLRRRPRLTRPQFPGRRSSGSQPRMQLRTSSSCSRAGSASTARACRKPASSCPADGGRTDAHTRFSLEATAGTCG